MWIAAWKLGTGALASAVLVAGLAPGALANTYRPNKTGDHAPGACTHADCTVREAVSAANAHSGHDVVVLKGGKSYDVTLDPGNVEDDNAAADLDVNDDLTVKASGTGFAALDAHHLNRVLDVGPSGDVNVKLSRIWVRNGLSTEGAGIRGGFAGIAALTLVHSRVTGSRTISDGSGGGIEVENGSSSNSSLKVIRSTISGNKSSGDGGGIAAVDIGLVSVKDSTISGNTAGHGGDAGGGGIFVINNATTLRMTNSTVTGNRSTSDGGGINVFSATAVLKNATIARNHADSDHAGSDTGGGIRLSSSTAQVSNTILALNTASGTGLDDCSGGSFGNVESLGRNLFSAPPTGCSDFDFPPNIVQANPHLGKLQSNGGPTKTIALLAGSKAINHASPAAPPRDQRGVTRQNPDIGAFELAR